MKENKKKFVQVGDKDPLFGNGYYHGESKDEKTRWYSTRPMRVEDFADLVAFALELNDDD